MRLKKKGWGRDFKPCEEKKCLEKQEGGNGRGEKRWRGGKKNERKERVEYKEEVKGENKEEVEVEVEVEEKV